MTIKIAHLSEKESSVEEAHTHTKKKSQNYEGQTLERKRYTA